VLWHRADSSARPIRAINEAALKLAGRPANYTQDSQSAWRISPIYPARWKTEETFRSTKWNYNLEDITLRTERRAGC
jgi:hypothetical protein